MSRRLVVMRHGKSDWGGAHDDHSRPLNQRGRRSAAQVAAHLAELGFAPDVVVSSDATRTRETWACMSAAFPDVEPVFTRRLYLAGPSEIVECISGLPTEVETVLVLGHNPGFSFACHWFAGAEVELKTADAALLEVDEDAWDGAAASHGWSLVDVVRSRALDAG